MLYTQNDFSTLALKSCILSTLALEFSTFQPPCERLSEQNPRLRLRWNSQRLLQALTPAGFFVPPGRPVLAVHVPVLHAAALPTTVVSLPLLVAMLAAISREVVRPQAF